MDAPSTIITTTRALGIPVYPRADIQERAALLAEQNPKSSLLVGSVLWLATNDMAVFEPLRQWVLHGRPHSQPPPTACLTGDWLPHPVA